jgi:hypothetical protein
MRKKITALLAALAATGGMAWAQQSVPNPTNPTMPGNFGDARQGLSGVPDFGVVGDLSTAARNSAGLFGSDADDFIDPRSYDAGMGKFLFVGVNDAARLDLGFGASLGGIYLGAYYGGRFADGSGSRLRPDASGEMDDLDMGNTDYDSNLAVLIGAAGMGFRVDVGMNGVIAKSLDDHPANLENGGYNNRRWNEVGPSVALTWGMSDMIDGLSPWVRVGYRFANVYENEVGEDDWGLVATHGIGAMIGAAVGADYDLSDESSLGFKLGFGSTFPTYESVTGTWPIDGSGTGYGSNGEEFSNRMGGAMGFTLDVNYLRTASVGFAELKLKPRLGAGLTNVSHDRDGAITWKEPWDRYVTVHGGVDLGAKVYVGEARRVAFVTGADVSLFDLGLYGQFGGDDQQPALDSGWILDGVGVSDLGLGVQLNPSENVEIGIGFGGILRNSGIFGSFDLTFSARLGGASQGGTR